MNTSQIQLKVSVSPQLNELFKAKALRFGVPVTQWIKYVLLKEVDKEAYPTYMASDNLEKISEKAMNEIDKSVEVKNIDEFFEKL